MKKKVKKLMQKLTALAAVSLLNGCTLPAIVSDECLWTAPIYLSKDGAKALEAKGNDADIAAIAGHNMKYEKICGLD